MSKSLGTLTLDLIAKVGAFVGPIDKATASTKKNTAEMRKSFESLASGIGAAIAGVPAIVTGLVTSSALAAKEISNLSNLAGLNTTEFQKYAAAAATVGIEQDKLSDIFKDTNDKVGDFLATGGGELKNFFETVAPKVGVTAEQFRDLNSADALQLYVSSLQKANVSQAQMTFFMEAIADEATALVPLLTDGGKKFQELGDAAEAAGAILSLKTIAVSKEFSTELVQMQQNLMGVKNGLANEFMPVLAQGAKDLNAFIKAAGGTKKITAELVSATVNIIVGVANTVDVVRGAFNMTASALVGTFATAMGYLQKIGAGANQILNFITWGDTAQGFRDTAKSFATDAQINFDVARLAAKDLNDEFNKPLAGEKFRKYVTDAQKAAAELPEITVPGIIGPGFVGQTDAQKAAAKEAEAAQKRINQAYESAEENLSRQIALINTSTDARKNATEVAKLMFDIESGKLTGINDKQAERLKGLAAELDVLKKIKQQNEDDKAVTSFGLSVNKQLDIDGRELRSPLLNSADSDQAKQRALELLAIEQDYQDQLEDLRQRYEANEVSETVYDRETQILDKALSDRLAMQQQYYTQVDELQSDGTAGFLNGFKTQAQAAMDLYSNMQNVGASAFTSLTDMVTDWAETGKLNVKDFAASFIQSIGHSLLAYAAAQVAMAGLNAFTAMIGIPFVGPAVAPGAAIAAAAAAGVLMTGVGAALSGQAHAGIDNIPREGTWLLDGGERVLSPAQNRDLTGYLQRANSFQATDKPGGGQMNVEVHNYASTKVDVQQDGDRMKVFIREAKKQIAGDLARGNGDVSKALAHGWSVKRSAR